MDTINNINNPLQIKNNVSTWSFSEPEPTTLIALCPGDQPPTLTMIVKAASDYLTVPLNIVEDLEAGHPKMVFSVVVELPFLKQRAIIFAEPAQPISPQELNDPAAVNCKWVVGIETLLDPLDAHSNFVELVRFLARTVADCPAIMDVNCERWLPKEMIPKLFFTQIDGKLIDPPEDMLWYVQAIGHRESQTAWVHTHGLWRCGNPELEMLQVPVDQVNKAYQLINTIAERLLEERPAEPGYDMQIGPQMNITMQPWEIVAPSLAKNMPGSMTDRIDPPHIGVRAVICSSTSHKGNMYPADVIDKMSSDNAALFPAIRVMDRLAALAKATWPALVNVFNTLPEQFLRTDNQPVVDSKEQMVRFVIKANLSSGSEPTDSPEHLWLIVQQFDDKNRAQAQLVHDPIQNAQHKMGDNIWVNREAISDWSVITTSSSYGPSQIEELTIAINELKQENAT